MVTDCSFLTYFRDTLFFVDNFIDFIFFREEETLRVLGLQIIGLLLISTPEKKGSWLLTIATGVTRSLYDSNRAERTKLIPLFSAIMERLIVFPFSDLVCASLFDMLLGGASLKQV